MRKFTKYPSNYLRRDSNNEIVMEDWLSLVDSIAPFINNSGTDMSVAKIQSWLKRNGFELSEEEADYLWDCVIRSESVDVNTSITCATEDLSEISFEYDGSIVYALIEQVNEL